ncbi:MAG: Sucrose-6-phosphate hydrolase [Tenericutes bacterium ADurb.Bin239]|nr:MAG: Sucrose-6-phosphate hydrolase [Tenericutes bacterium ADurb.Bin239]
MANTKLFYKPAHAIIADCIPYYENGVYHIFYLLDYRLKEEVGTPWFKITTKDFVTFKDHGEMLKRGHKEEYDQYVFTGSVFKTPDGLYHIWYTGHNIDMDPGNYVQAVMHAVSRDLENWTKIPEDTFIAPSSGEYEHRDWRDPYVFFNEQTKEYNMLLTTRMSNGPKLRRGATTLLVSKDFKKWEIKRPFYAPELYYAHECPDLFKMGEWYYHVFSEFSRYHVTRYVMAKSLTGPWLKPRNDKFDGRAYYAAKTVSDGQRRFILGWNPTKEGNVDNGLWQWGGNLVVHELFQNKDGTLRVKMVDEIDNAFAKGQALKFVTRDKKPVDLSHIESLTKVFTAYSEVDNTNTYQLEFKFRYHSKAARIGLLLNTSPEDDTGYGFFVEPHHQRLVFELFPVFPQYSYLSVYLERPISVKEGTLNTLKVIVEDNMAIAYLNDEVALSTRMYNFKSNKVGVLVHGEASVENITFKKIK